MGTTRVPPSPRDAGYRSAVGAALLFGLLVRLSFVGASDFPLNDGGLFYTMVRDLQQTEYVLPAYTSYNSAGIPFAYPPLALYLAGVLEDLTPWELITIFRFGPLLVSIFTIVAFARFSRTVLSSPVASACAVFAFTFLPMSYLWVIMGGGLTRSLGLLFSILALHQAYLLYTSKRAGHVLPTIVLAAGTVLSHPEAAWFAVYSIAIMLLSYGRNRQGIINSFLVAAGTVAVTAPWWVTVVRQHGTVLLRSFEDSGYPIYTGVINLLTLEMTKESGFPLIGVLALFGVLVCLARGQVFLPLWLVGIHVLQVRAGEQKAVVPLALLAGIGAAEVLLPLLNSGQALKPPCQPTRLAKVVLAFVLLYAMLAAIGGYRSTLAGLPRGEREAMEWVAENTPLASGVLVIPSVTWWGTDSTSEWFPVLADRASVATVQGHEWLGDISQQIASYEAVQQCATKGPDCLDAWAERTGAAFTYLYVAKASASLAGDRAASLRHHLDRDLRYVRVYDGPAATIYCLDHQPTNCIAPSSLPSIVPGVASPPSSARSR